MKVSDLKIQDCKGFEERVKDFRDYFGTHFDNLLKDFSETHKTFIVKSCGNPDIPEEQRDNAENALLNYFTYYCFGVGNTVNPTSNFNSQFQDARTNSIMQNIERMAQKQEQGKE